MKKKNIPKSVKVDVWNTYIGPTIMDYRCICCKHTLIKNTSFHVGHVHPEANNRTLEIANLRQYAQRVILQWKQ